MNRNKRIVAALLTLVLAVGGLPVAANARDVMPDNLSRLIPADLNPEELKPLVDLTGEPDNIQTPALPENEPAAATSGTCGDNLTWSVDGDALTISGTGDMYDYSPENPAPWNHLCDTICYITLENGVTSIGKLALANMPNLMRCGIADTVTYIGDSAFKGSSCGIVTGLVFLGDQPTFHQNALNQFSGWGHYFRAWDPYSLTQHGGSITWRRGTVILDDSSRFLYSLNEPINPEELRFKAYPSTFVEDLYDYTPGEIIIGEYDNSTCGEKSVRLKVDGEGMIYTYMVTEENDLTDTITVEYDQIYEYTGSLIYPQPVVRSGDQILGHPGHYTITHDNFKTLGDGNTFTITGKGIYSGYEKTFPYTIVKQDIASAVDSVYVGNAEFYGMPVAPEVKVYWNLKEGEDYLVIYEDNVNIGTGTAQIVGIGGYTGTITKNFQINKKDTTLYLDGAFSGNAAEATCKEAGEKTYTCTACGHTKTETVANSDSHSYGSWSKVDDNTHKHSCTICGKEETSAHTFDGGKVTKEPTCMNPGEKTYTCTACGHTKVETVAKTDSHSYGKWEKVDDNTHKHSCTICGKEETASHSWDSVKVTMEPNCKNTGEKTYTCADCGHKKTETLPVTTTHGFGTWTKVDDSTHVHTCADCGKEETAAHAWNKGVVTKSPTCMAEGEKTYTCTGCGHTKTEVVARMNTHTYDHACDTDCNLCGQKRSTSHSYESAWSKDANGHWHKCAICGDKKDAAAHIPGPEATEETAQTCTVCGYVITPALSHEHSYADTWTTDEIGHWYACSGCEEPDSLAAHDFENTCAPDCGVCGYTREITHAYAEDWDSGSEKHWHTCTVCGEIAGEETHTPGAEATATTAQTCLVCGYEIAEALGEDTEPPTEAPTPGNPVSGSLWWIIIAAVAVCGTCVLVMVLKKKKRE